MRPRKHKCIIENMRVRPQTPGTGRAQLQRREIAGKHIFGAHLKEMKVDRMEESVRCEMKSVSMLAAVHCQHTRG